jgi:DNA gyrase/topoisomerase IV subunit B
MIDFENRQDVEENARQIEHDILQNYPDSELDIYLLSRREAEVLTEFTHLFAHEEENEEEVEEETKIQEKESVSPENSEIEVISEETGETADSDTEEPVIIQKEEYYIRINGVVFHSQVDILLTPDFLDQESFKVLFRCFKKIGYEKGCEFTIFENEEEKQKGKGIKELWGFFEKQAKKGFSLQRYKGLGEMNPEQLWDTTLNPEFRTMVCMKLEDVVEADETFSILMGDQVPPRRAFIEKNAIHVTNLDL